MNAQEIATESGVPVGPQGQPAGAVGSPPVDPAAAAAAAGGQPGAPAAGAPADPAAMAADPMAGAASPEEQQTVEEMAAAGDPLAMFLMKMFKILEIHSEILLSIADKMQLQQPASQAYQGRLKDVEAKTATIKEHLRSVVRGDTVAGVIDTSEDDDDCPEELKRGSAPQLAKPEATEAVVASSSLGAPVGGAPSSRNRFLNSTTIPVASAAAGFARRRP